MTDESAIADRFGDELERRLDGQPAATDDAEVIRLLKTTGRLRQEAPPDEPAPAFVSRLRAELVGRDGFPPRFDDV